MCERPEVGSRENVFSEKVRIPKDSRSLEFWTTFNEKAFKRAQGKALPLDSPSS